MDFVIQNIGSILLGAIAFGAILVGLAKWAGRNDYKQGCASDSN